ncbi:MAG: HAMP domain-containing protein [Myxococcales bacterium]|nr:HAMP domain-containing protein [Myxococcales bacterium]
MSDRKRSARFGLRAQIMLTILLVGVAEGAIGAYRVYRAHREWSGSAYLGRHFERFEAHRKDLGEGLAAAAALAVRGFRLGDALRDDALDQLPDVTQALAETAAPDLVMLVDARRRTVRGRGLTTLPDDELARSRLVADALSGLVLTAQLAVVGDEVYQVSSAPARSSDDDVVRGALILGTRLSRMAQRLAEQSNADPTQRVRLVLAKQSGNIYFAAFPDDEMAGLAEALHPERWRVIQDGQREVNVIAHNGALWHFHQSDLVRGYDGGELGDLGDFYILRQANEQQRFEERVSESLSSLVLTGLLTLAVGWLLAWFITRRINLYVAATEDLARGQGDLTRRLEVGRRDELGRLAENLNAVFGHIHDLAAKVQRAAFQVGASSAEISAASRQMLDGAQEQARKTESSTAAVTELSASIQQVAENATEATRVARKSGAAVEDAISRMSGIRTTVDEAAARIQDLGESGKRIGNIVEVIRQISDQTTLLALNAAIEAAHAGEHGKGFAVVADEVSSLAKRVGQSARDIEELIATIREQTVEAVRAMDAGTREVEEGTKLVTHTLADLHSLLQVVEDTAQAVQEQAVASDEIARNMDAVQRIAADVLSSSEEAVDQGEHLHRLAHGLEESVKGFRIDASRIVDEAPALPPSEAPKALGKGKG